MPDFRLSKLFSRMCGQQKTAAGNEVYSVTDGSDFDAVVVGGGPAGCATASLLALDNRNVLLLEREKFPRYHIGESLISAVWPTLDRLNLRDRVAELGSPRKYGGTVRWGKDGEFWSFAFGDAGPYEYAYQVQRAQFDALLMARAREVGVTVIEEALVREPIFDGSRICGATYSLHAEERVRKVNCKILVDASGQRRWLGTRFNLVKWHEDLRNLAIWAYFQGAQRYDKLESGNTLIEYTNPGWLWFIPLAQELTSVGFVCPAASIAGGRESLEALFTAKLDGSVEVRRMLSAAVRVSGYRTERDWSYRCTSYHGPGWVMVGDASAFVDPLLSTGVALALRSARTAAEAIAEALDDPNSEADALQRYESDSRRYLQVILDFVRYFYLQDKTRTDYYNEAQRLVPGSGAFPPQFDFVKLVAGLADEKLDPRPHTLLGS